MKLESIDDGNFESKLAQWENVPQVVLFWAPWSKPCQLTSEALTDFAMNFSGKLKLFCMNIDENANVPASLGIKVIPQVTLMQGGTVLRSLEGRQPKLRIREFLEEAIGETSP